MAQIATMFVLFVLALAALIAITHAFAGLAVGLLLLGFVGIMLLDPIAARHGHAPIFFARLRPPQMAIAVISLAAILASLWLRG